MNAGDRKKVMSRVKRIAGQVEGVRRMLEADRYCIEILHQVAAVRSALDSLGIELLSKHLECCVVGHGGKDTHECARPMTNERLLAEVKQALSQFLK